MKCPNCGSTEGNYDEYWDEWVNEEGIEEAYCTAYWDCDKCNHRVMGYDPEYETED